MTTCTHHSCVRKVPIFQGANDMVIEQIETIIHQRYYKKNNYIFYQGDPANALYVINKGIVKLYKVSDDGKEQTIRLLFPGDFFGQSSLVSRKSHYVSAQVLEETQLCVLNQNDFQTVMNEHPDLVLNMFYAINNRLHEADEWMSSISLHEVERRLAKFILLFYEKLPQTHDFFQLPFAKKELAPLIGSSRETVSRKLVSFEERGIIKMNGQRNIRVLDLESLNDIAGVD